MFCKISFELACMWLYGIMNLDSNTMGGYDERGRNCATTWRGAVVAYTKTKLKPHWITDAVFVCAEPVMNASTKQSNTLRPSSTK